MRVWARITLNHKIQSDVVQEFALARPSDIYGWTTIIDILCQKLDIERPIILNKHINDLIHFSNTFFKQSDFMDTVSFDRFEIEIFPDKKEKSS